MSVDFDDLLYEKMTFGESGEKGWFSQRFAESLGKAWPKKAFPWKLGGLNYGLVMSRFQGTRSEGSPDSSSVEASEREQGPTS